MKYPLIESLGLSVKYPVDFGHHNVIASELEAVLSMGAIVHGGHSGITTFYKCPSDTYSGLLINYKPMEKPKPVSKSEILEALKANYENDSCLLAGLSILSERIQKAGVSNE